MSTILKEIREAKGFTQVQIANKAGVTVRLYQDYEYDKTTPNVRTAIRIAKVLGTTVESLFPYSDRQVGV